MRHRDGLMPGASAAQRGDVLCELADLVPDLLAEVRRLTAERDEVRANYRFMVERAADRRLDGYRELGARAAAAENERDSLRAEISDLRAVLDDEEGGQP